MGKGSTQGVGERRESRWARVAFGQQFQQSKQMYGQTFSQGSTFGHCTNIEIFKKHNTCLVIKLVCLWCPGSGATKDLLCNAA